MSNQDTKRGVTGREHAEVDKAFRQTSGAPRRPTARQIAERKKAARNRKIAIISICSVILVVLIGLIIGMALNSLVFPYDNRKQIRFTMESVDRELIRFLEDLFDGDDNIPDPEAAARKIGDMDKQLKIFAEQKLYMRPSRQRRELNAYRAYEEKAGQLVAHMEVLREMKRPGRLNDENRRKLAANGADIRDRRELVSQTTQDVVTNYHVQQILILRSELLEILKQEN